MDILLEVWGRRGRKQEAYLLPLLPDTPHTMDPYRGTLERCTVRRCSVPGWPVPSLSAPTPLTAANSVQVRRWTLRPLGADKALHCLVLGEGMHSEGGWKGILS